MTSFNEGIEAAYQEALKCVGESTDPISGAESWMAQHIADRIADLKRPEPSEEDKALRLARYLWERNGLEEWDDDPDYWMDYAFDALKATESGGTDNDK